MQNLIDELLRLAREPNSVLRNPRVAALIVDRQNQIIASGVHFGQGSDHAEIAALKKLSRDLSDSTLYVSLEPCNHHGVTGPCTEAIIKSGIRKVVIGSLDINPVSGGGITSLKSAGLEVRVIGDQAQFRELNFRWFESIKLARPYVALKAAITQDGFLSKFEGQRTQITNQEALRQAHRLRSEFDAILVGTNTLEIDNPQLTVRLESGEIERQPLKIVMGKRQLSDSLKIFSSPGEAKHLKTHDPQVVLRELSELQINTLLLEGGAKIYSAFIQAKLVDEYCLFVSPKIFGSGVPVIDLLSENLPASRLKVKSVISLGEDLLIRAQNIRG